MLIREKPALPGTLLIEGWSRAWLTLPSATGRKHESRLRVESRLVAGACRYYGRVREQRPIWTTVVTITSVSCELLSSSLLLGTESHRELDVGIAEILTVAVRWDENNERIERQIKLKCVH